MRCIQCGYMEDKVIDSRVSKDGTCIRRRRECLRCRYYFACRGECPKHRFETGSDGCRKNTLCEGLYHYFRHVEPYMEYMREMLSKEQSPAWVIPFARKRMGLM